MPNSFCDKYYEGFVHPHSHCTTQNAAKIFKDCVTYVGKDIWWGETFQNPLETLQDLGLKRQE